MKMKIKGLHALIAGAAMGFASVASAVPTLFLDGVFDYSAPTGSLVSTGLLTASEDVTPAPELLGSSYSITASYDSDGVTSTGAIIGHFSGVPAAADLLIKDGLGVTLLEGDFSFLDMVGPSGFDMGIMSAGFMPTGGSLASSFNSGELFALQLNLSTTFSSTMFSSDFDGLLDGRLTSVPEPSVLLLLAAGLLVVPVSRFTRKS